MLAQATAAVLGIWLMASPGVLGYDEPAATIAWIVGPIVASIAFCAAFAILRDLRLANIPAGLTLLVAPAVLDHEAAAVLNSVAVGLLLVGLSLVRGRREDRYAGGWRSLLE